MTNTIESLKEAVAAKVSKRIEADPVVLWETRLFLMMHMSNVTHL